MRLAALRAVRVSDFGNCAPDIGQSHGDLPLAVRERDPSVALWAVSAAPCSRDRPDGW